MVALGFIEDQFGVDISWGAWFLYAAPFSIIMSIALFFIMITLIKPETDKIEGGKEVIKQQLAELRSIKRSRNSLNYYFRRFTILLGNRRYLFTHLIQRL